MNSATMHVYLMKQDLNREYDIVFEFFAQMGLGDTKSTIDAIALVDSEEKSEDGEWKGLTQTLKVFIDKKLKLVQE